MCKTTETLPTKPKIRQIGSRHFAVIIIVRRSSVDDILVPVHLSAICQKISGITYGRQGKRSDAISKNERHPPTPRGLPDPDFRCQCRPQFLPLLHNMIFSLTRSHNYYIIRQL